MKISLLVSYYLIQAYIFVVIVRVFWSWTALYPHNPLVRKFYAPPYYYFVRALYALVDPVVKPLRRKISTGQNTYIDLGPVILILILILAQTAVRRFLLSLQ